MRLSGDRDGKSVILRSLDREDAESLTRDHDIAEAVAPDTALPISEPAHRLLRAIKEGGLER
jgi:hypothetical protein